MADSKEVPQAFRPVQLAATQPCQGPLCTFDEYVLQALARAAPLPLAFRSFWSSRNAALAALQQSSVRQMVLSFPPCEEAAFLSRINYHASVWHRGQRLAALLKWAALSWSLLGGPRALPAALAACCAALALCLITGKRRRGAHVPLVLYRRQLALVSRAPH